MKGSAIEFQDSGHRHTEETWHYYDVLCSAAQPVVSLESGIGRVPRATIRILSVSLSMSMRRFDAKTPNRKRPSVFPA